jgi:hypothetical protein
VATKIPSRTLATFCCALHTVFSRKMCLFCFLFVLVRLYQRKTGRFTSSSGASTVVPARYQQGMQNVPADSPARPKSHAKFKHGRRHFLSCMTALENSLKQGSVAMKLANMV